MNESATPAPHALPAGLLHDLRTPLNQIIGYAELLIDQTREQGPPSVVADLQKTQAAGQRLLTLINENFYPTGLPAASAPTAPKLTAEPVPEDSVDGEPPAASAHGLVLVVDDIEANREVLSRRLVRQGYTVALAKDGRQALEIVRTAAFDLVLLDIMMPELDGYEVLRQLKADEALRHIPVIMISALSELDSVVRCIELGAEDYLPKPFNPTLLKARIGACLEKKRARDREALLFAQLQVRNLEMARWREVQEADLAVAQTTQEAIVGTPLPRLDGWQVETVYTPLIQVGGDVYGWRQLDRGLWLFWLADATGHGVAAALFTTLVASLFERAASASNTARGILTRVNAEFFSVLRGRSFMTACCAVIDAEGRLAFAGAGHPSLLIRRSGAGVEAIASRNTMMGMDPTVELGETATTLAPGETALLYSDGLHSLKAPDGERLTSENVAEVFAGLDGRTELLPRLIAALVGQSDAQPFEDDLAAITLRRA